MVNIPPPAEIGSLTTAPHKPFLAPTGSNVEDTASGAEIDKQKALKDTLANLKSVTERLDSSKIEEIEKRVDRMEVMWSEDKLNSIVHKKLLEISIGKW